jgi:hypothetical protein
LVAWQKSFAEGLAPAAQAEQEPPHPVGDKSTDHVKMIMLAFHNYHSVNGHFPPSAIFGADGQPKLSWRVALLPFLDQKDLFHAFHLDEPWDSPHNKALVARMPDVFTTPSSATAAGTTRLRLFEGPGTMFADKRGIKIAEMTDGTSNTVAVIAAREAVPWTQPGELPFPQANWMAVLDNSDEKGVLLGTADGACHRVSGADEAFWKALITPAGGEVLVWPSAGAPKVQPTQQKPAATSLPTQRNITPVPASSISPELDARLRAIETKLDRLMQKLDVADKR